MPYRFYRIEMKATLVSMAIALVVIVVLSFYLHGGSLPPHPADASPLPPQPFSLASDPSDPLLIQSPLLQEPFHGQPPSVVSVSDTAYDAMTAKQRTDFLHQVQQVIRGEILASRQLEHPEHEYEQVCDNGKDDNYKAEGECDAETSLSERHGREYQKQQGKEGKEYKEYKQEQRNKYRCPKNPDGSCPPFPDMTQYIRKDQIPCWGCSVDY